MAIAAADAADRVDQLIILTERLTDLIAELRRSSCNAGIGVLVGGRVFDEAPNLATEVGADVYARDPDEALKLAEGTLADIHHFA